MKGELTELDGLQVVHDRKDALFHLTGVLCAKNDHLHTLKVDFYRSGGAHALGETIGRELSSIVDDKIGFAEFLELLLGGTDEHVVHEQGMVGSGTDDADLDAIFGIPAGETIKDIHEFARVEVVDSTFTIDFEGVCGHVIKIVSCGQ